MSPTDELCELLGRGPLEVEDLRWQSVLTSNLNHHRPTGYGPYTHGMMIVTPHCCQIHVISTEPYRTHGPGEKSLAQGEHQGTLLLSLDGSSLVFTNTTFTYLQEEEEEVKKTRRRRRRRKRRWR